MVRKWGLFFALCAIAVDAKAEIVSDCITLIDNADLTATGTGTIYNIAQYNPATLNAEAFTGVALAVNDSGTTPTLDIKIQTCETQVASSCADTPIVFDQCTTGSCYGGDGVQRIDINKTTVNMFPFFRVSYTLAGTSPNYDVEVKICYR